MTFLKLTRLNSIFTLASFAFIICCATGNLVFAQTPAPPAPPSAPSPPSAPNAPRRPQFAFEFGGENFIGVGTENLTAANMARLNMSDARGVMVTSVVTNSPAERAGLKKDDVIVRFDDETVTSTRKLTRLINEAAPGANVRLTVNRQGAEQQLNVTLGKRNEYQNALLDLNQNLTAEQREQIRKQTSEARRRVEEMRRNLPNMTDRPFALTFGANRRIGIQTTELTEQLGEHLRVEGRRGLLVTSVTKDSPADKAGLRAGDVITQVDNEPTARVGDLTRLLNRRTEGEVELKIVRDRKERTLRVTPERTQGRSGNLGDLRLGEIDFSDITVPQINIPQISIPQINVQPVVVPRIEMPRINLPPIVISGRTIL